MARWNKGQSGNPRGRPRAGTAIADLARRQVDKHKLIDKLASIAAGLNEYSEVDVGQQLRAIQLLLNYGYGPPRAEVQSSEGVVIQVVYAETNQIAITDAAHGAVTGNSGVKAIQRALLRAPLGQDAAGNGPPDSSGAPG